MGIWVGRFAIVDGEVREQSPWLAEQRRVQDDEAVRLVVLAEPVDDRSSEFCAEVASAVADLFSQESLSLTGGLLRALRQADANLAEWNRRSLREHQVTVGVTCVAIRGHEATVGQLGPGLVYLDGPEGLRRVTTEGEAAAAPLGGGSAIEPQFIAVSLLDTRVLLLTSSAETTAEPATIGQALRAGPERALADVFLHTRTVPNLTAVLVTEVDLPDEALAAAPADYGLPKVASSTSDVYEERGRPREEEPPSPAGIPPRPTPRAEPPEGTRAAAEPGARASAVAEPAAPPRPPMARPPTGPTIGSGSPTPAVPQRRQSLPTLRRPRVAGSGGPGPPWRLLSLVLVAVVALVVIGVCAVPSLLEGDQAGELESALADANNSLARASSTQDVVVQRTELEAGLAAVEEARAIDAEDPRVSSVEALLLQRVAALDHVIEIAETRQVLRFDGTLTAPLSADALVLGGADLWLVDGERGRVFRVDPERLRDPEEVYRAGERYGEVEAGAPIDVAWDAESGRLLVLDERHALFAIDPDAPLVPATADDGQDGAAGAEGDTADVATEGGPVPLVLRGADEIAAVAAIDVYLGNLYLLDPNAGEVWRYLPAGDGYDSERDGLLGGLPIDDAQELLVDGDVFVLGAEEVRHFSVGSELDAMLRGIDRALVEPTGIVEDPAGTFYVADHGNRRIVASTRAGEFVAQYTHPSFSDLRGLALSADGTTLFVLLGDAIVAFEPATAGS